MADRTRRALKSTAIGARLLSDEQLETSRQNALRGWNPKRPLWIFGYGSLIWNPQLLFRREATARIYGLRRQLCLWSRINRGTDECPGLVLGLEPGGSCRGVAYEIEARHVAHETALLWRREMLMGSYVPVWAVAHLSDGKQVPALTFRVNPDSPGHARGISETQMLETIRAANGRYGSCADYVGNTARSLLAVGIRDQQLLALCEKAGIALNPIPNHG
jgi:glutathione-specific gamma-glutamylcyclotransferase